MSDTSSSAVSAGKSLASFSSYVGRIPSATTSSLNRYAVWIFVAGAAMLGVSIGLNAVSTHGTCTAAFVAVAAVLGFGLSSIQTLDKVSWLAWVGLIGIVTASTCPLLRISISSSLE